MIVKRLQIGASNGPCQLQKDLMRYAENNRLPSILRQRTSQMQSLGNRCRRPLFIRYIDFDVWGDSDW